MDFPSPTDPLIWGEILSEKAHPHRSHGRNGGLLVAFSGAHGTGKTTSVYHYAYCLKRSTRFSVGVLTEMARECPYPILGRGNTRPGRKAQRWIFERHLERENALISAYDVVISDRTLVDTIAYSLLAGHAFEAEWMLSVVRQFPPDRYFRVYFRQIATNPWCFDDGCRDRDDDRRCRVEQIMRELYEQLHIEVSLC